MKNIDDENEPSDPKYIEKDKEWIINRTCNALDIYHDQLNANKQKLEKIYDEQISTITNWRNGFLSIITFIATVLFSLGPAGVLQDSVLLGIALSIDLVFGLVIYIYFTLKKQKKSSRLLDIQKAFHDGYTTISFKKGFLMKNSIYIDQLTEDILYSLNDYYSLIQGGIATKIRKSILKHMTEDDVYGQNEKRLYTMLIERVNKLYVKKSGLENNILKLFENDKDNDLFVVFNNYYIEELKNK